MPRRTTRRASAAIVAGIHLRVGHWLVLALGVLTIVGGLGCTRSDRGVERGNNDGGTYSIVRTKNGGETRVRLGPGPIPPEFPPNMPLYPGAEFSSTARTAKSVILALSTTDALDAVFAFYRKQPGYEEISDADVDDMRVLHLKHAASGKDFQVIVKISGHRTEVSLVAPLL